MISVIIPVYNVESYLAQCLDSVLAQTYRDLEILLIDDGSTDRSGSICDAYQAKDERIKVFHTENHGLSAARNVGLDYASGAYILLLDSDDWIDADAIRILKKYAKEQDADVVSCAYNCEWRNHTDSLEKIDKPIILEERQIMRAHIMELHPGYLAWNKLYRSELFSNIRYPEGRSFEDILTTYRLLILAQKAVCIPDILFHYRMRANSISRTYSLDSMIAYWQAHVERLTALLKAYPEYEDGLVRDCFSAINRMCRWYSSFSKAERAKAETVMREMQSFAEKYASKVIKNRDFPIITKVSCICAKTRSFMLFVLLHFLMKVCMIRKNREWYAY